MLSDAQIEKRFFDLVNMSAEELHEWLKTDESKQVGFVRRGEHESVGRQSAKKIIRILEHGPSAGAVGHMRKVVGYIKRHSAQRPKGDVTNTRWRYSLMNWGHDPLGRGKI